MPTYPCKISWDYCKKINSDNIINQWKMIFQALDGKGRHFLELVDNNLKDIGPSYTKGGPWLQLFGHSNTLCACATRAITNHAPIREYWLRFFPNEEFKYPYRNYPIESRRHILHNCMRFNGYWNPRRDSLSHFVIFLIANPNAFVFIDNYQPIVPSWTWNHFYFYFYAFTFLFLFSFSFLDFMISSLFSSLLFLFFQFSC